MNPTHRATLGGAARAGARENRNVDEVIQDLINKVNLAPKASKAILIREALVNLTNGFDIKLTTEFGTSGYSLQYSDDSDINAILSHRDGNAYAEAILF